MDENVRWICLSENCNRSFRVMNASVIDVLYCPFCGQDVDEYENQRMRKRITAKSSLESEQRVMSLGIDIEEIGVIHLGVVTIV